MQAVATQEATKMRQSSDKSAPTETALDRKVQEDQYDADSGNNTPDEKDRKFQLNGLDGEEGALGEDGEAAPAIIIPLKYRIAAIILIILFGTGNTYAGFVLGPLKTRLVRELKITSALSV